MTNADLKKIQENGTQMLSYVDEVCRKNNIEYFLLWGTLLGAVRHGGSIPWDDDIDIAMTRENYNKFLNIVQKELDPKYELHIMGTTGPKGLSELKIGLKGSKLYLPGTENYDVVLQLVLDVFLLDYVKPLNEKQKKWLKLKSNAFKFITLPWDEKKILFYMIEQSGHRFKILYKAALTATHLLRIVLGEKFFKKSLYNSYVDETGASHKIGCVCSYGLISWNDYDLLPTTEIMYDGIKVKAVHNADAILKTLYGDYMQLPPEEKRRRNHFDEYILELP